MSVSLLSTKLYIPPVRANAITRPRLTEKLRSGIDRPGSLTLLSGPAGFGKTSLLSEFIFQLGQPAAWVSLDEGDNEPVQFWSYTITACQTVKAGLGEAALALLHSPQSLPVETIPTILINELASLEQDLILVLDDYHMIQNEAIHSALAFLLEHLPGRLHFVVSTRSDPPWPLARLRARDQLIEVRAQDLRFTYDEAASFLAQIMGLNLNSEDVAALEERTEGWAAGLQLAALSMKGRSDIAGFVKAFTGSHVFIAEYLLEEVLKQQPEDIQTFLLQTSILEQLNPALCEAVSSCEDGRSMLIRLQKANLFVIPLDDEGQWYRYHHLFADLLKARLLQSRPADFSEILHRRAAAWYEQEDMAPEAIEHALAAKDYSHALQLIEKIALPMILKAYFKTVEDWLRAIPPEYQSINPRANMAFAWMHLMRRDFAQAAPYLQHLQELFSTADWDEIEPSLQGEWLALQSMLLNAQGKAAESINLAEQALKILPGEATQVRSVTYMGLADAYQQTLDYERAAEACERIIQQGRLGGDLASEIFGISYLGRMVLQQGKLHAASEIASGALQRIERTGASSPFGATLYGELAQVHYEWHQLDTARRYFSLSVDLSTLGGFSDAEIYHSVFLSRLFQMEGDLQTSLQEMEKALDLMRTAAPSLVNEEVICQQVSIYLALDRLEAAQTAIKANGFTFENGYSFPELTVNAGIPHPLGLLYNSALRILLYRGTARREADALMRGIELAGIVIEGSLRCRHLPIVLKTLLLRSQIQAALGDEQAQLADIAKVLELAEPESFISTFIEEGTPIAHALTTLLERKLNRTVQPSYIQKIRAAFPNAQLANLTLGEQPGPDQSGARGASFKASAAADEALVEPLTRRELEVLRLIAEGCSNQTIAEKLVITVSAVKKHTGNIYGKLNVESRTQAVARARQLGLLALDG